VRGRWRLEERWRLFAEPVEGGGCRVTSYWVSMQWDAEGDRRFIRAMGSYVDTCVKVDGRWRIKEKLIDPWNSATAPMVGHAR
jgi:SnoaL-like domain